MFKNTLIIIQLLLLTILSSMLSMTHASITSVSVSPSSQSVNVGMNTTLTLTWTVKSDRPPRTGTTTVSSTSGDFLLNGTTRIGVVNTTLTGVVTPSSTTTTLTETITILSSVIASANSAGATSFTYQRTFSDGDPTRITGTAALNITIIVPPAAVIVPPVTPTLSVTSSSTSQHLGLGTTGLFPINWSISTNVSSDTVSSSQGTFIGANSNRVFGISSQNLSSAITNASGARLSESLTIPSSISYQAQKAGDSAILYQRTFSLKTNSISAVSIVIIPLTTNTGADFQISYIDLSFEDHSILKSIDVRQQIYPQALIRFSGSGSLQAVWEVAYPFTALENPVYRPLQQVRQFITGGGQTRIVGPSLPNNEKGFYLVRLRILAPTSGLDSTLIRYIVGQSSQPSKVITPSEINILTPDDKSQYQSEFVFQWQMIHDAKLYQLEVYEDTTGDIPSQPYTGAIIPADATSLQLSIITNSHLESGKSYLWRIVGLNIRGEVLAKSNLRKFSVP